MMAPQFRFSARAADGSRVRGTMRATSTGELVAGLRGRGLFATAVQEEDEHGVAAALRRRLRPLKREAMVVFMRALATMVHAGLPISRALVVAAEQARDRRLAAVLAGVRADVEGGLSLSAAAARYPQAFSAVHVALFAAGEAGGVLDDILERLADVLERERTLRRQLGVVLIYPSLVAATAAGVIGFLAVTVVPMFAGLFAQLALELPLPTRAVLSAGSALRQPLFWLAAGLLAALPLLCLRGARRIAGSSTFARRLLHVPVFGELARKALCARMLRTLALLIGAGVDVMSALRVVGGVAGNAALAEAVRATRGALEQGDPIGPAMAATGVFGPLAVALIRVGEETGALDRMLAIAARHYEAEVDAGTAALGALLEPLLIGVLGVVVAVVVLAVFIPLYALVGNIT